MRRIVNFLANSRNNGNAVCVYYSAPIVLTTKQVNIDGVSKLVDLNVFDERLDNGEKLQATYEYQVSEPNISCSATYRTRTDRILAVEPTSGRVFVNFRGEMPVWVERHAILKIESIG